MKILLDTILFAIALLFLYLLWSYASKSSQPKPLLSSPNSTVNPQESTIVAKYLRSSYQKFKQQQEKNMSHKKVTLSIASIVQKSTQKKEERNITALFSSLNENKRAKKLKSIASQVANKKSQEMTLEGTLHPKKAQAPLQ